MKDIKFILLALASNLASFAVTHYAVLEIWKHSPVAGRRSLQDDCCDCNTAERICNGLASNCNQPANAIMYASLHNAMATRDDGFFIAINHDNRLEEALDAGFRGFMLDSCNCGGDTELCHGECLFGTRNPGQVFVNMVSFLKANPNEVLVLEFQIEDDTLFSLWESASAEFKAFLYAHPNRNTAWPTLGELIDLEQRIIFFQHNGGNCDAQGGCPLGVHEMWDYGFETDWDLQGVAELGDYSKSCTVRTGQATRQWFLNNHFAKNGPIASKNVAEIVNARQFLQDRLDACTAILGRRTNMLAVDYWSIGDVLEVVMDSNAALGDAALVSKVAEPDPTAFLNGEEEEDIDEEQESDPGNIFGERDRDPFDERGTP